MMNFEHLVKLWLSVLQIEDHLLAEEDQIVTGRSLKRLCKRLSLIRRKNLGLNELLRSDLKTSFEN